MNPANPLASFALISVPNSVHPPQESFQNLPQINTDIHLVHTLRGIGSMTIAGQTFQTDPTCVFCIPPQVPCLYTKKSGPPWEMINLHVLLAPSSTPSDRPLLPLRFCPPNIHTIHTRLQTIRRHAVTPGPWGHTRALSGALALVLSYLQTHGQITHASPIQDPLAESIRQALDAKAAIPIDIDTLAASAGLSRSQLSRRFKAHTGQSLKQYWTARRLAVIQSLLRDTDSSLDKIARQLEFSDVFYLSRWFSIHAKLSPTDYRKKSRAITH